MQTTTEPERTKGAALAWSDELGRSFFRVCRRYKDGIDRKAIEARLAADGIMAVDTCPYSGPSLKDDAEASVAYGNEKYPEIHHWVILA